VCHCLRSLVVNALLALNDAEGVLLQTAYHRLLPALPLDLKTLLEISGLEGID
jgi:hypothetical protein